MALHRLLELLNECKQYILDMKSNAFYGVLMTAGEALKREKLQVLIVLILLLTTNVPSLKLCISSCVVLVLASSCERQK